MFAYHAQLLEYIQHGESSDVKLQMASIRTMVEFVKREYLFREETIANGGRKSFGLSSYRLLLKALLHADQIDVEVLLMLRSDVFAKADCAFYALHILRVLLSQLKTEHQRSGSEFPSNVVTNALDLLRILAVPEAIEVDVESLEESMLVPIPHSADDDPTTVNKDGDVDESIDSDDEDDDDGDEPGEEGDVDVNEVDQRPKTAKELRVLQKRKAEEDLLASLSGIKKKSKTEKTTTIASKATKKGRKLPLSRQVLSLKFHKRIFSKTWLLFLSLPSITIAQHKLILRHLPQHLLGSFNKPILLADYLTSCYKLGGIISVLALESLFELIVRYNLDYPQFFESLYRLCTLEVFSAKYRSKFMKLLSACLKSTNLASYTVASFIKRLARVSLVAPANSTVFCVAQITWLLREHPDCLVLIHRKSTTLPDASSTSLPVPDDFDDGQLTDLQQTGALDSSLWELEALKLHYSSAVRDMVLSLETNYASTLNPALATANGTGPQSIASAPPLVMADFHEQTYESMLEAELKKSGRKQAPLAHRLPKGLFESTNESNEKPSMVNLFVQQFA